MLCAIYAGRKGRRVLVLEQSAKCGLKILVSGGGRCNFTNIWTDPQEHFLSANAHFCISALRRIRQRILSRWWKITILPTTRKSQANCFVTEVRKTYWPCCCSTLGMRACRSRHGRKCRALKPPTQAASRLPPGHIAFLQIEWCWPPAACRCQKYPAI